MDWTEQNDKSAGRKSYFESLEAFFAQSPRPLIERLQDFAKYVPATAIARFLARYELFKLIQDIPGAIVEAGVLGGGGLMSLAHCSFLLEPHHQHRKLIGFDTFAGFPHIADVDRRGSSQFMQVGAYEDDSLEELTSCARIHESFRMLDRREQIELVRGDIVKTVPGYLDAHPELVVALLYLDCDLYEPTKTCLEHLVPRMPRGAVIAFDELNLREYPGETAALADTLGIGALRLRRFAFLKVSYAVIE